MGVICIASLHALPVLPYWTWLVLFHYMLSWFFLTGHGLHCFSSSPTCSFLLGIVCIVSHPSLVHHYWAWLVSSSLSMVCIVSFHASLFLPCLLWLALLHLMIHWFIIAGWCVIDSSLLGMACIVSLSSLVHHYCTWVVFFHFKHHWLIITGHCLHCFTSSLTDSSLQGMVRFISMLSLFHLYWSWFVLLRIPHWFSITEHGWVCFIPLFIHHYWACFVFFYFTHCFIIIVHDLYCFSSSLIGSCVLGIVCIVLHPSLVHH